MKTVSLFFAIALLCAIGIESSAQTGTKAAGQQKTETFKVWGNCDMCKARIEKAVKSEGATTADWNKNTKILTVTFDPSKTNVDALDKNLSIQVFRVIQECLTNVIRHAHADRVSIHLENIHQPQAVLQLKVIDNGCGCDLNSISKGFGLQGMQERVKSLHGALSVQSQPGAGMTVTARIPLL